MPARLPHRPRSTALSSILLAVGVCALPIRVLAAEAPAPRVLTLEQALALAMEHNRAIQTAAERVEQSRGAAGQAASPSRLQTRLEGTVTRVDEKTTFSVPSPTGTQKVTVGNLYTRTVRLTATQPLDISGSLRGTRSIANLRVDLALLDLERVREQTLLDVKTAFYQVLRAQAALAVAQANVASLEDHLRQAQSFYKVGVAAQFDVLRAEAQVANARQAVIAGRNAVALAKAALNNTMGIDVTTPIEVRAEDGLEITRPDFAESLRLAHERRAEVKQAQVATEMARRGVSVARKGDLPTLALSANLNYNVDTTAFSPRSTQWTAVAVASLPILDGGLTRARVREARADLDAARVAEEQVREAVALEVQQAILSINEAAERLEAARANMAQAREALRLAKVRYQEGVSTPIEVTDAQAVFTQAESNEVNARYDYLMARARLERAIGPKQAETK